MEKTENRPNHSPPPPRLDAAKEDRPWSVFCDSIEKAPKPKYRMISLFSGCGGSDLGFRFAGFDVLWANDINADACKTYRNNIGGEIVSGDIRKIELPKKEEEIDLLSACFPCQPFSNAGARRGAKDGKNGDLNEFALKAVEHFRPKIVVCENVRGMLSIKDDKGKLIIVGFCRKLSRLGYDAYFWLADSSKNRVAQKRIRLFVVGVKTGAIKGKFPYPLPQSDKGLTLGETFHGIDQKLPNADEVVKLSSLAERFCRFIPAGGSWKNIPYRYMTGRFRKIRRQKDRYRQPNFYRRFGYDEIAGTITASFKPENSGVLHPDLEEKRAYSVREAARIQSFPDWFEFHGKTPAAMCRQIGNAVPPRLAYEIGQLAASALEKKKTEDRKYMSFASFRALRRPFRTNDDCVFLAASKRSQK